jgi:hypothetical protein
MPKKKQEDDNSNKPWVSNYPVLQAWLDNHGARCMWQTPREEKPRNAEWDWSPQAYIECWIVGTRQCILIVYANKGGWNIFTDVNTPRVDETLADAERRCGLT